MNDFQPVRRPPHRRVAAVSHSVAVTVATAAHLSALSSRWFNCYNRRHGSCVHCVHHLTLIYFRLVHFSCLVSLFSCLCELLWMLGRHRRSPIIQHSRLSNGPIGSLGWRRSWAVSGSATLNAPLVLANRIGQWKEVDYLAGFILSWLPEPAQIEFNLPWICSRQFDYEFNHLRELIWLLISGNSVFYREQICIWNLATADSYYFLVASTHFGKFQSSVYANEHNGLGNFKP